MRMRIIGLMLVMAVLVLSAGCNLQPTPCSVAYLILKINDANATPLTTDVINLAAGCTYALDQVDNITDGNNGLPAITSPIVIRGNGAIIMRESSSLERFRLFYISSLGSLEISRVTLMGGYAYNPADPNDITTNGGGAILNQGHLTVYSSLIQENIAREGGGIFNTWYMTLKGVTIVSNHDFDGNPGGAGVHNAGPATIENSTIYHNGIPGVKDGIYNAYESGTLVMTNSTVNNNGGAGIDNEGILTLNHVTIAFNGRLAVASNGDLYISNSIIAQPPGTFGCGDPWTVHPVPPIIDTTGTCGGNVVDIASIRLGPLADNGGPTQTYALLHGSVAIDIVNTPCLPTDQRGEPRPFGPKCDAGAYEFIGMLPPIIGTAEISTATFTLTPSLTVLFLPSWTPTLPPDPLYVPCSGLDRIECTKYPRCKWVLVLTHPGGSYCTDN